MDLDSLARLAYDSLLDKIARRELRPGEHLVERTLAEELGVSRTPLRDALKRLAGQGLVEESRNRGCFVSKRSLDEVVLMCEARQAIEGMAARLWALRAAPETVTQLRTLTDRLTTTAQAGNLVEYYHSDFLFHRQLVRLCDNPYLSDLANAEALILNSFINMPSLSLIPEHTWGETAALATVVSAIEAHDPDKAEATIREHIGEFNRLVSEMARADVLSLGMDPAAPAPL